MNQFIFVHGAWHAGWSWEKVTSKLQANGYSTIALDLPSHGQCNIPKIETSLASYSSYVEKMLSAQPVPSILVGHSMGGMVVSQAAENVTGHVRAIVYVTAFLPKHGESLSTYASQDGNSLIPESISVDENGISTIKPDCARAVFYADSTDADVDKAIGRLEEQNTAVLEQTVSLKEENFGAIPKYYIRCTQDYAISIELQDLMCKNWHMEQIETLDTDHSPFLSRPSELASLLHDFSRLIDRKR